MPKLDLLDLTDLASYTQSCLKLAQTKFAHFSTIDEIGQQEENLNSYPRLDKLLEPKNLIILEKTPFEENLAINAILEGLVFWEHAAAGEATRLKMGPKYQINPSLIKEEAFHKIVPNFHDKKISDYLPFNPLELKPWTLGTRHMAQLAFELTILAEKAGINPQKVLEKQQLLVILGENMAEETLKDFFNYNFFNFKAENCLFLIQPSFFGLNLKQGRFFYDQTSNKRLHNHGQMIMQSTFEKAVFYLDKQQKKNYLSSLEFKNRLEKCADKVSYNIEDLDYLSQALDFQTTALALYLGDKGYGMTMEIVSNNPQNPIKGGMCAYDSELERNVVVESFQLKNLKAKDIKFLNKNFNHFPKPALIWQTLKEKALPMPISVKDNFLYFQPVQGDLNFLSKTAYIAREILKPIQSWKTPQETKIAMLAFKKQDQQKGFIGFIEMLTK